MGKEYTRNANLIEEAEAELRAVQAHHRTQQAQQQRLQQQVDLLEGAVEQEDSLTVMVHRMMLRALAAQEAAATAARAAAAAAEADPDAPQREPEPPLLLHELPLSLLGYHNALLQRASNMTLDNCVHMYKTFVESTLKGVHHIQCHGDQSYIKQELTQTVARFSNLMLLHGFLQLPVQKKYFTLNFQTGDVEDAPAGWYARIARLIPLHQEFAGLVQAGITCLHKSMSRRVQPELGGDVMEKLQELTLKNEAAGSKEYNLATLEQLVDACGRSATSVLLLRTMVSTYIFAGSLRFFDAVVVGHVLSSCWPYPPRGMVVYEEYCKREDVQALLPQQVEVGGSGGGGAAASPLQGAAGQQRRRQRQQRNSATGTGTTGTSSSGQQQQQQRRQQQQ